jgi:uncharacterized repeat protein (TIGR01451 family)
MLRGHQPLLRLTLALALGLAAAAAYAQHPFKPVKPPVATAKVTAPTPARVAVMVELFDTPAAYDYAAKLADASVSKAQALANARAAARAKVALLAPLHQRLAAQLAAAPIGAQELFRAKKALNGIAVMVAPSRIAAIKALPEVKRVRIMPPEYRSNITSVPFIGAPPAWGNALGLGKSLTGKGVRIGIIDTGIDYQHPMFGGSGLLADYQANDRVTIHPGLFPTPKVVGGFDFAGDAYDATNTPVPDPNPMDCNDHGSHVAGTAAGFGVNGDGTTFTGPYGPGAPPSSLRIGPGVAPEASLYAIRIFGCGGATNLVTEGIEFAMDPSGRGDFSDHLDVINLSLGAPFGGLNDVDAQAADAAAQVGVLVAIAQGNDGDTYFIGGSPASADYSVSAAAIIDSGIPGSVLEVTAPASVAGNYAAAAADFGFAQTPNPSGQSGNVVLVQSATGTAVQGCDANYTNAADITGNIALIERGTCGFQVKVGNAQAAGAIGAIVFNNVPGDPTLINMGAATATPVITIPSVFISLADGMTLAAASDVVATLAAANAGDTLASFTSRGPRGGGTFPIRLKPDVSAPGLNIPSTQSGITCTTASNAGCINPSATGFIPGGQVLVLSGTSMATPHTAGSLALLRQLHPDWSVEEIKALLMNGAVHDITIGSNGSGPRYGPGRIGAGRIDIPAAATSEVTVFNDDDPGLVTLGFDSPVVTSVDQIKNLRVVNHGAQAQSFDLAFDNIVGAPGVTYSLVNAGQAHLTVPAASAIQVQVQMQADATKMDHTSDPTIAPTQAAPAPLSSLGNLPRTWLTEAGTYLTFSQGGTLKLRVPLYSAPVPSSAMTAAAPIATNGSGAGTSAVLLSGVGVCTGSLTAQGCSGNFPLTETSLVSPFELQLANPLNQFLPGFANVQYAGVSYDSVNNLLLFGISTWGPWSTPNDVSFSVYVDTQNNGTFDKILFDSSPGMISGSLFNSGAVGTDTFLTAVFDVASQQISTEQFVNLLDPSQVDSRLFGNNVMILAVSPGDLGLKGNKFRYRIETCPGFAPLCTPLFGFNYESDPGPFTWDLGAQGLDFGGSWLAADLDGAALPVNFNVGNLVNNGSLGALLLHTHNANGTQGQAIPVDNARFADLAVSSAVSPATLKPQLGQVVTLTLSVNNTGPDRARDVSVFDFLPTGLDYVADDGGGAYNPADGGWFIGQLAPGATATLHIQALVTAGGEIVNTAQIASTKPLDPNPANDISNLTIGAPRLADIAVSAAAKAAGQAVTFTITLKNNGFNPSYNPRVNVILGGARYNGAVITPSSGTFDPVAGIWQLGSVGVGTTSTLTIALHAPHSSTVGISATAIPSTPDPNLINNRASASVTVH